MTNTSSPPSAGGAPLSEPRPSRVWRVADRATFAAFRGSPARARSGVLTITRVSASAAEPPRLAFAIGRATGSAVTRNRVRRRLRAQFGQLAPPPGSYLVAVAPDAARASSAELRRDLAAALTRLERRPE